MHLLFEARPAKIRGDSQLLLLSKRQGATMLINLLCSWPMKELSWVDFPVKCHAAGWVKLAEGRVWALFFVRPLNQRPLRLLNQRKGRKGRGGGIHPLSNAGRHTHFSEELFVIYHGASPTYEAEEYIYIFQLHC